MNKNYLQHGINAIAVKVLKMRLIHKLKFSYNPKVSA